MAQKVFVLVSFVNSNIDPDTPLIAKYWGANDRSIKFLAHSSYLRRLALKTGYVAFKVSKIYDQDQVNGQWISFDKKDIEKINASKSKTRYFVVKKEALDGILGVDMNAAVLGAEIGIEYIGIKKIYSVLIGAATFNYVMGGGGGTPGAGAKLP